MRRGRYVLTHLSAHNAANCDDAHVEWLALSRSAALESNRHQVYMANPFRTGMHALARDKRELTRSLFVSQAQRALATRAFQNADPGELTSRLKKGQIEQLTIELQQVSLVQPNPEEAVLAKKLRE